MAAKFFLVACASALLVNTIAGCPCGSTGSGWPSAAIGNIGCGLSSGFAASNRLAYGSGGPLNVAVSAPIAPSGLSILSENVIDGWLEVTGSAPLLAAVAFEGNIPSAGTAGTSYRCGNGNVGISAESLAAAGLSSGALGARAIGAGLNAAAANYGAGINRANIGAGISAPWAGSSCGCGIY